MFIRPWVPGQKDSRVWSLLLELVLKLMGGPSQTPMTLSDEPTCLPSTFVQLTVCGQHMCLMNKVQTLIHLRAQETVWDLLEDKKGRDVECKREEWKLVEAITWPLSISDYMIYRSRDEPLPDT